MITQHKNKGKQLISKTVSKILQSSIAVALLVSLNGCNSSDDTATIPTSPVMANDYNAFKAGVINANTLKNYIDDWQANKPEGTKGRLVILQAGPTSQGKFIKQDEANGVYVYQIPAAGACDPSYLRHDGVANIPGALLSGPYVDYMINMFGLNPEEDYVLFAMGEGSVGIREIIRSWWVLVYWGWDDSRLAFLNGSVTYDFSDSSGLSDYLGTTTSTPPATPTSYSMKSLQTDRTDLQVYIEYMMDLAQKDDKSGYFLADARGSDEYNGVVKSKTLDKNCGPAHNEQCYSPFQGHIKDAIDFPYTDLFIMDDQTEDINGDGQVDAADASYKLKSPIELQTLYAQKGYKEGDKVVAYCRTGRKATLLAITSYAVLKYPFAMYDGSWIQWGEMANRFDVNGTEIMPSDSRWLTDDSKYSVNLGYTDPLYTQSAAMYDINNSALHSDKIVLEDKAYLGL
jgi:3-mercaptopyruvate sulfurtransferase SseA